MNNWKEIWANRVATTDTELNHEALLKLNGYDGKQSDLNPVNLGEAQKKYARMMRLERGESIYEVACGAGAFLWDWKSPQFHTVGGCDISPSLIGYATEAIPQGAWSVADAESFTVERWDHVVSFGLCMYIPQVTMEKLMTRMLIKARRSISLFDIPDYSKMEDCEAEREKLIPNYKEKYTGLEHYYHKKEDVARFFDSLGLDYEIYDQDIPGYENAKWRFNVTAWL